MEQEKKIFDILIEIAGLYNKRPRRGGRSVSREKLTALIEEALKYLLFREYGLDEKDILCVAVLFNAYLNDKMDTSARKIIERVEGRGRALLRGIERIERLREKGIVEAEVEKAPPLMKGRLSDTKLKGLNILNAELYLTEEFLEELSTLNGNTTTHSYTPYRDNYEYLVDQFKRIKLIELIKDGEDDEIDFLRRRRRCRLFSTRGVERLKRLEKRIAERLKTTAIEFSLERFKKENALTREEEIIIIALLKVEVLKEDPYTAEELLWLISNNTYERLTNRRLFSKEGRLMRKQIICMEKIGAIYGEDELVRLNRTLIERFTEEKKRKKKGPIDIEDNIFEVITPKVSLDSVILHPRTREAITLAMETVSGDTGRILRKWGLSGVGLLQAQGKKQGRYSVTMLFYGPPGTGKTLTAVALAGKLRRKLLSVDCSKILSSWVGESEKNTKRIFTRYREISAKMKKPPVLFLNEADQLLSRRTLPDRAADHMYNQMQNILLEELENFNGILIATTNLLINLDPAFSRRFHYRIEFKRPGVRERLMLWQVHLKGIPLEDDVDLEYLSGRYELSGAQIALCVRAATIRAARRLGRVSKKDLITACEEELSTSFDERSKKKIGF